MGAAAGGEPGGRAPSIYDKETVGAYDAQSSADEFTQIIDHLPWARGAPPASHSAAGTARPWYNWVRQAKATTRRCPVPRPFWHSLIPQQYLQSVYDLDLDDLRKRGITGLILDLDNTLAAWRFGEPEPRLAEWMKEVKASGLKPYIVSNDLGPRVDLFTRFLDVQGVARAGKPRRKAFRDALRVLGLPAEQVAVVGDQVFTDMLGAGPLGCHTILVVPVSRREFAGTRVVRRVERLFLCFLARRGLIVEPSRRPGRNGSDTPDRKGD